MEELVRRHPLKHHGVQDRPVVLCQDGRHLELMWLKMRYNYIITNGSVYCSDLS